MEHCDGCGGGTCCGGGGHSMRSVPRSLCPPWVSRRILGVFALLMHRWIAGLFRAAAGAVRAAVGNAGVWSSDVGWTWTGRSRAIDPATGVGVGSVWRLPLVVPLPWISVSSFAASASLNVSTVSAPLGDRPLLYEHRVTSGVPGVSGSRSRISKRHTTVLVSEEPNGHIAAAGVPEALSPAVLRRKRLLFAEIVVAPSDDRRKTSGDISDFFNARLMSFVRQEQEQEQQEKSEEQQRRSVAPAVATLSLRDVVSLYKAATPRGLPHLAPLPHDDPLPPPSTILRCVLSDTTELVFVDSTLVGDDAVTVLTAALKGAKIVDGREGVTW